MNEFQKLEEETLSSREIFDGKVLHVFEDEIILPNGHKATREVIRHVGAVGMVPMTADGKIIIERQFRYPLGRVITEIPAGKLDSKAEDRLDAAKRELREETGYTAEEWIELGDYYPAAAYCDECVSLYLAKGLTKGTQELDEDEFLNLVEVPLEELVEEVLKGMITDGKTQAAILKTAFYCKRG